MCRRFLDIENKKAEEKNPFAGYNPEDLLQKIYSGEVNINNLDEELYKKISEHLVDGMLSGYGKKVEDTAWGSPDHQVLKSLQENIYVFSAAKTYQQTKDLTLSMVTEDGIKTFSDFKKDALEVFKQYNLDWLNTEFNTAVKQAQSAAKWSEIQEFKDILPYLEYKTVGDGNVREEHAELDGLVYPVDHPFWDQFMPPNDWGCRCDVIQHDYESAEPSDTKLSEIDYEPSDLFTGNPGKTGFVFDENHPYFKLEDWEKPSIENNFGLPMPEIIEPERPVAGPSYEDIVRASTEYWDKHVTYDQRNAVVSYTGSDYRLMNKYLRGQLKGQKVDSWVTDQVKHMKKALDKAPKFEGQVYRGLRFEDRKEADKFLKQFKPGGMATMKGFTSTSADPEKATGFTGYSIHNSKVVFQIEAKRGVALEPISHVDSEKEIVLQHNSTFEVVSKQFIDGVTMIKLKEI